MRTSSFTKALLVVILALAAWLVPLWWALRKKDEGGFPTAAAPPPSSSDSLKPLILYVEGWPTRRKLDLKEIQGVTAESESTLAPAHVAESLYAELGALGITPEIHRLDRTPDSLDLAKFKPVVFIYPVRHGRPAAEVGTFFDRRVEPFIARHHGAAGLSVSDIAVGETTADTENARASFAVMNRYYGIPHGGGQCLSPEQSWREERQRIAAQARAIHEEVKP